MREKADYQNVFHLEEEKGRQLMEEAEGMRKRIVARIEMKISDFYNEDNN